MFCEMYPVYQTKQSQHKAQLWFTALSQSTNNLTIIIVIELKV